MMNAVPVASLAGQALRGWHVDDGTLWVRTDVGKMPCACACGRTHLLPTEEAAPHRLLLHCHGCGRAYAFELAS